MSIRIPDSSTAIRVGGLLSIIVASAIVIGCERGGTTAQVTEVDSTPTTNSTPSKPPQMDGDEQPQPTGQSVRRAKAAEPAPMPLKAIVKKATAEQIAKWAIPEHTELELLECYDGFTENNIQQLAVSVDGTSFAIAGNRLTLWTLGESKPKVDFLRHARGKVSLPMRTVDMSPDGKLLAAGDDKGMLRIWSIDDNTEILAKQAYESRLVHVAFAPDSKQLVTTSYSGAIKLWDVDRGRLLKEMEVDKYELKRLRFVSKTSILTVGNETCIWNLDSGKKHVLNEGYNNHAGVAVSPDGQWLVYSGDQSNLQFWDLKEAKKGPTIDRAVGRFIDFSADGKLIATYGHNSQIQIWDRESKQKVQVIDADGTQIMGLRWLPQGLLLLANNKGRIRIWGTPENGDRFGMKRLAEPIPTTLDKSGDKPAFSAQLIQLLDLRSFPQLPNPTDISEDPHILTYTAPCTVKEAIAFYRHILAQREWIEVEDESKDQWQFQKGFYRCGFIIREQAVNNPSDSVKLTPQPLTRIHIQFSGGRDIRKLPYHPNRIPEESFASPNQYYYKTTGELTDIETFFLKQLHALGWTAYGRPDTSYHETPDETSLSFIQRGSMLSVWIRQPNPDGTRIIMLSTSPTNRSLPIPPDCGFVEYTNSVEQRLVATTKLNLSDAIAFYDRAMAQHGWLSREAGRHINKEKKAAWLPYIRGQQDLKIRLIVLEDGSIRILVGDVESSSWQLEEPKPVPPEILAVGLEAADYPFPDGTTGIKYDVEDWGIDFRLAGTSAATAIEHCVPKLKMLGWIRDDSGNRGDKYELADFEKQDVEITVRARTSEKGLVDVNVQGEGLLWSKALPVAPVRVSYETWLRRNRHTATLDRLDEFTAEMKQLPIPVQTTTQ